MLLSRRELLSLGGASLALRALPSFAGRDAERAAVVPEYDRTLESVLLAVPAGTMSFGVPDEGDGPGVAALARFLEVVFRDVLAALPSYTIVHAVAHASRRDLASHVMKLAGSRALWHLVTEPGVEIELFAQDMGEPMTVGGETKFLVGLRMDSGLGDLAAMSAARRRTAEYVFGAENVNEAGFVFEGGNLAFDGSGGALRVLSGFGTVRHTLEHHRRRGERPTHREVEERIASTFGGAEVVLMDEERQSPLLQHLDQAFVLLRDRIAVANRLVGTSLREERRQLDRYAGVLRELGYSVLFVDHTAEDLEKGHLSINAVPFVDRASGARRVLFPVFPGEMAEDATAASRDVLRRKGARAFDVYRDAGYDPVPIRDVTHALGGNTHCILNALA